MKIHIANTGCKETLVRLKACLDRMGISYENDIYLGEISLPAVKTGLQLVKLKNLLSEEGFEVLCDRKKIIAEQVKMIIAAMLAEEEQPRVNYSVYISQRIFLNYTYVANLFSEVEGITIEHYIINQKIELSKNLLLNSNLGIVDIAAALYYSSVGHFSNQFKKVTGITPSEFKRQVKMAG